MGPLVLESPLLNLLKSSMLKTVQTDGLVRQSSVTLPTHLLPFTQPMRKDFLHS
jgi:hypothetical protein